MYWLVQGAYRKCSLVLKSTGHGTVKNEVMTPIPPIHIDHVLPHTHLDHPLPHIPGSHPSTHLWITTPHTRVIPITHPWITHTHIYMHHYCMQKVKLVLTSTLGQKSVTLYFGSHVFRYLLCSQQNHIGLHDISFFS